MICLSLYSGECDGLGLAAEMVGMEVAAYCEADETRRARLAAKHPGKPIFASDTEVTSDAMQALGIKPDFIFGGPPCQPFSVAGKQRATADPRHRWPEMRRIIHEQRPRWIVVENVGGFVSLALDLVLADLENEDYETGAIVLPAMAVGAPHRRDRCFVVAHRGSVGRGKQGNVCEQPRGTAIERPGKSLADGHSIGGQKKCQPSDDETAYAEPDGGNKERVWDGDRLRQTGEYGRRPVQQPADGNGADAGAIKSRLGRALDGISARLDAQMTRWPAWRGQAQYDWEPPRTGHKIQERSRRIESLGLAVCPWQAYPIMALIAAAEKGAD